MINSYDINKYDIEKYALRWGMGEFFSNFSGKKYNLLDAVTTLIGSFNGKLTSYGYENKFNEDLKKNRVYGKEAQQQLENFRKTKLKKFCKMRSSFIKSLNEVENSLKQISELDEISYICTSYSDLDKLNNKNKNLSKLINEMQKLKKEISSLRKKIEKHTLKKLSDANKSKFVSTYGNQMPTIYKLSHDQNKFRVEFFKRVSYTKVPEIHNKIRIKDLRKELYNSNKKIDKDYDTRREYSEKNLKELFNDINKVAYNLNKIEDKKVKKDINEEITTIRRVVKPKIMSISKKYIEKMRTSDKLISDLQMFKEDSKYIFFYHKSSTGKSIHKTLENVKKLIERSLTEEEKSKLDVSIDKMENDRIVSESKKALINYKSTIDKVIHQQNISSDMNIRNNQIQSEISNLSSERYKYAQSQGEVYSAGYEVIGGDVREHFKKRDHSKEISEIDEKIQQKRQQIKSNKETEEKVKNEKIEVDERYKNMKDKLNSQSNLKKGIFVNTYNGGMKL